MTDKLFYQDAYAREFWADTQATWDNGDGTWSVVLDRTAFYPAGGGQPADQGTLDGSPVIDVKSQDGQVVHVVRGRPPQGRVKGVLDWCRRFDHMQQHSGEHVLLGAFYRLFRANSCGFQLGETVSRIDLDNATLTPAQIAQAEDLANSIVFADRPVSSHWLQPGQELPAELRKKPTREFAALRLVVVEGFDACPCGGTHVAHTGEIGLIKILHWEHKKKGLRLYYVAGSRALTEFQRQNAALRRMSALLSTPVPEVPDAVSRLQDKVAQQGRRLHQLSQELCEMLAEKLLQNGEVVNGIKLVVHRLAAANLEVPQLAASLAAHRQVVALIAGWDPEAGRGEIVFARGAGVKADMKALLLPVLAAVDGKGGGTGQSARGVFRRLEGLPAALAAARRRLLAELAADAVIKP